MKSNITVFALKFVVFASHIGQKRRSGHPGRDLANSFIRSVVAVQIPVTDVGRVYAPKFAVVRSLAFKESRNKKAGKVVALYTYI